MINQHVADVVNIAQVFAHSIVYFAREQTGHVADLYAMGDPAAPSASETTAQMMQGYAQNLEPLLRVTNRNILPTEQAQLDAQRQLAPQQNQLELDIAKEFGPQFANARAASDLSVLQGPGRDLAREATAVAREADPEYYKGREIGLKAMEQLFGSLDDPSGGLSGSERAEVERSMNRDNAARGNNNPTAIGTIENAMKFGAAGDARKANKQQRVANALGVASGFLPAAQSKVDTFQVVTGRPSQQPGVAPVGQNTYQFGSQLLGQAGANAQQTNSINANRRSGLDKALSFGPNVISSIFG